VCILMQSIQEHRDDREFMKGLSLYFLGAFGICWLCLGPVVLDARLQEDMYSSSHLGNCSWGPLMRK
jgi:hypothetical protein